MLNEMIKDQHALVADLMKQQSETALLKAVIPSDRDFYAALQKSGSKFILECKHRSPSEGRLREDYPIIELAKTYEPFADIISVLTNERHFDGSFTHLQQVRQHVNVPVLCKDIIVAPYQVALARQYGADAILLMLSVLDDTTYLACQQLAEKLKMGILTEVVNPQELQRAKKLKAKVIAINHRDLHTLTLDMERVVSLAPLFPKETIMIAASGLNTHQDIARLKPYVKGFLIGGALSKSQDIAITLRELRYGAIKICGLTSSIDSQYSYEHGAILGGLIFAASSPRTINLAQAEEIIKGAPLQYVGVFAKQPIHDVIHIATTLKLHAIQLHGQETADYIAKLRPLLPKSCQIWFAVSGHQPLPLTLPPHIDKLIIDNMAPTQLGGTGRSFDWNKLRHFHLRQHCLLAGGVGLHNIIAATQTKLAGLDINSSIEQTPGIKDHLKIKQLFQMIRENT
ncbi:bifunctional indole-3-glycerol-phosphate synthase TrpC/phosphoribosylanthranilate isomerase TrpF [Candidatus Berkiella aquae]|uniref:N-(5'-phosphoribosyl)anthranilate isomerase n=1 Tax=Candidatus Berkiella aquae TaxID=295108 RepID=A0A0Q9YKR4_9GAMM|nr:bifunctional indole-3-glycerol-phosphate synthase TrpC/phosphoribosylanthranilate isomerase TrpF [Candidatus Berkiella aquae]MCS5710877.1 bifunctional indole-3-glycerol-phosphate synthase TrpC/phosphoribosylanthranilate isomerase TrpF [Candidatus Berkiella aquae]